MTSLLILGASGLVGRNALAQALADPRITAVIAPTRSRLQAHPKLINPVAHELMSLLPEVALRPVTAILCAIGTTIGKAGSKDAFRSVDYDLPLAFARRTHQPETKTFALVSAIGASSSSSFFFARVKGDLERDLALIGFKSLTIVRPSIISGQRGESRLGESVALSLARFLRPVLPRRFHENPASRIAEVLIESIMTEAPGNHFIYSDQLTQQSLRSDVKGWRSMPMTGSTEAIEAAELIYLRSRIFSLESCVCDLLWKNEQLRTALSSDASRMWAARNEAGLNQWQHSQS